MDSLSLEAWFERNKRDLPWRQNRTPYRVWISEVMLQQTRASVVVSYFQRWMQRFPHIKALYMAPMESVIKAWEGLGYYSRARHLHEAAKQIVEHFGGELPDTREALLSLRGFGPYTAAAVLSFGFQKPTLAVDGNVLRVLSRYFAVEENISKSSVRRQIEHRGEVLLDIHQPWVSAEALIELGATLCLPKPRCADCPLKQRCLAFSQGKTETLPIKNENKPLTVLKRTVFVIEHEGSVWVKKGPLGKVMADLYEFPYVEMEERSTLFAALKTLYPGTLTQLRRLPLVTHTFTRYKAFLSPVWLKASTRHSTPDHEWVPLSRLCELPFSSGHRKIANEVTKR